jgi:peptide/nickel transport system substrate-binding protein
VVWHDGKPFTADDVIFTWEYAADPATGAVTSGSYQNIKRIDKLDEHTVKVTFVEPTPFWYDAFCGVGGQSSQTPGGRVQRAKFPQFPV